MVSLLLMLRDEVSGREPVDRSHGDGDAADRDAGAVNRYFHDRLVALPEIAAYLDGLSQSSP